MLADGNTCKIRGKDAVVRVQNLYWGQEGRVMITCLQEIINKRVVFRSPSRLIAELGEHMPAFWKPKRIVAPTLPRLGYVAALRFLRALEVGTQNALTVWASNYKVKLPYGEYKGRVRLAAKTLLSRGTKV